MQAKTKRRIKWAVLSSAAVVVLGAGLTVYLLQRPPAVWREAQQTLAQTTPQERKAIADGVMDRLSSAVHRLESGHDAVLGQELQADRHKLTQRIVNHPVDETFELELSNEELLSVAADWADKWIAQRGFEMPKQMGQPLVLMEDGKLMIAFEVVVGSWKQVFSGRVAMRFDPDGMAHGSVRELTAGSLPMSVTSVGDWIAKQLPASQAQRAKQIGDWIAELDDFAFRPVLELEHRRRARVIAMRSKKDSLVMTMRLQDHLTYKLHNTLMQAGSVAVTDTVSPLIFEGSAIADVPTTTD